MAFSIAFIGIDGAGKTTLINKIDNILRRAGYEWKVTHQNGFMKRFYHHNPSRRWAWLNHIELRIKNWLWKGWINYNCLLLDRCYICSLVYANLEGYPDISHRIKNHALRPDVIILLEPVEELVPNAYDFTREYKKILTEEGYKYFRKGFHFFGRTTFWKQPETQVPQLLKSVLDIIGSP